MSIVMFVFGLLFGMGIVWVARAMERVSQEQAAESKPKPKPKPKPRSESMYVPRAWCATWRRRAYGERAKRREMQAKVQYLNGQIGELYRLWTEPRNN
jgi:hypothetical protein